MIKKLKTLGFRMINRLKTVMDWAKMILGKWIIFLDVDEESIG